jgi:2-oxoisovalerate dehydrogenase E2 component (dihydrolipoyl transacylase)
MARFTFRLPDIGEGIAEAEIVAWHKQLGDVITENEPLADMMTDKATVELESPVTGTIVELGGETGARIAIGSALAVIETVEDMDEVAAEAAMMDPPEVAPAPEPETVPTPVAVVPAPPVAAPEPVVPDVAVVETAKLAQVLASPAVRARARDLGIDLAAVSPAGEHVRHADLDAFLRYGGSQGYSANTSNGWADEQVKVIGLRRRIAENMAASKRNIPHFSYVDEIEVTALETMREQLNRHRGARPKLTLLPFLAVAICRTLRDFPMMNAHYDDEAGVVTRHGRVHLGIATQTDAGLMVPVLRDAQDRNIWQIAAEVVRLADAARTGKAAREELSGSTITLSSLGPLGGIASTPVINRPEVAIIAPNKIVERAVFEGDKVRRALVMNLSVSCDHRVVDGWDAASFVQGVRVLIEAPGLLFQD